MGEYYKLKLNCARTIVNSDMSEENGFLNIGIKKRGARKGCRASEEDYVFVPEYIIARKVGTHFEELFFGIKIEYDPYGVHEGIESLNTEGYSMRDLQEELAKGITCFEYEKVKNKEAKEFIKSIQFSVVTMKNYRDELKFIGGKESVNIMMRKKEEKELVRSRKI